MSFLKYIYFFNKLRIAFILSEIFKNSIQKFFQEFKDIVEILT